MLIWLLFVDFMLVLHIHLYPGPLLVRSHSPHMYSYLVVAAPAGTEWGEGVRPTTALSETYWSLLKSVDFLKLLPALRALKSTPVGLTLFKGITYFFLIKGEFLL